MQLNDSTKTIGALIAVLLIPLAIIGWNFYTSQSSAVKNEQLTVEEQNSDSNGIDLDVDLNGEMNADGLKVLGDQTNGQAQNDGTQNNDQNSNGIGGVKSLPNTSRHPTPDVE